MSDFGHFFVANKVQRVVQSGRSVWTQNFRQMTEVANAEGGEKLLNAHLKGWISTKIERTN